MPGLFVSEPAYFAEAADVMRLFASSEPVEALPGPEPGKTGTAALVQLGKEAAVAAVYEDGELQAECRDETAFLPLRRSAERSSIRQRKHQMKRALYNALAEAGRRQLPWGSLTGIRPVKLFRELTSVHGPDAARQEFSCAYEVSTSRVRLAEVIYAEQQKLLADAPAGLCVYAGIPFCPTRCRYCSFIAQDVAGARSVREQYLQALLDEIRAFAGGPEAACIYIGGGTPTTLSGGELTQLIRVLRETFPHAAEFTLEAGRPDTITPEVFAIAASEGVSRLSINPQTASDRTLARIGRAHSAADYRRAMQLERPASLLINSDMIIGLPGENVQDVEATLDMILEGKPDNITVHALAVKKAADLALSSDWTMMPPAEAEEAARLVAERLEQAGYRPYYLYRQKYMSGNLENVGYARPGTGCLYNVLHMEELASVLALGAGGISKRVFTDSQRIERSANVKDARQYVERLDEMIERKKQLFGAGKTAEQIM
ncbi:MAG: coproporphyrinogen dehydrogenase HemZ [Clostridia bacterium]|nr:coproporphyrinogen dehydrogenase HemZ [Clostridia bacterium]